MKGVKVEGLPGGLDRDWQCEEKGRKRELDRGSPFLSFAREG